MTRQEVGGELEFGYRVRESLSIVTSGYFGGGWFDFSTPAANGKIEDWSWQVRLGLDREFQLSDRTTAWFGMGGQYGESRSLLESQPLSALNELHDPGPEVSLVGGYARSGVSTQLGGPTRGYIQAAASIYQAHARQPVLASDYNWLGSSLEFTVGVRLMLGRRKSN